MPTKFSANVETVGAEPVARFAAAMSGIISVGEKCGARRNKGLGALQQSSRPVEGEGGEAQRNGCFGAQVLKVIVFGFEEFDVFAIYCRLGFGAEVEGFDVIQVLGSAVQSDLRFTTLDGIEFYAHMVRAISGHLLGRPLLRGFYSRTMVWPIQASLFLAKNIYFGNRNRILAVGK